MERTLLKLGAVLSGVGFLLLLACMQFDPDDFVKLDTIAGSLVHPLQTLSWVQFFIAIATLGSVTGTVLVALLLASFLRKHPRLVVRLVLLLGAVSASVSLVKSLIGRIRPEALPWIGNLHSFSFPSGHAATALALFGFIAFVHTHGYGGLKRNPLVHLLCAFLILAIGVSRIVLAAHYASDVLAGYLLGAFWLAFVLWLPLPRRLPGIG